MNLGNGKSGDWDILAENINMIIGDTSEDYGLDLTLFFGEFGEAIEPVEIEPQIGLVPEYVVIPFHQFLLRVEGDLRILTEKQMLADIFMPIRLSPRREQELFQIRMPLKLTCDEADIVTIQMAIRLFLPSEQLLFTINAPLRVQVAQVLFSIHASIKTFEMSKRKLARLKKHTQTLDEI